MSRKYFTSAVHDLPLFGIQVGDMVHPVGRPDRAGKVSSVDENDEGVWVTVTYPWRESAPGSGIWWGPFVHRMALSYWRKVQ